jgi:molybdenum cofactor biosynthesis protein B
MAIDPNNVFHPVRIAILTVSDTRSPTEDVSGDLLAARVTGAGHILAERALVRDDVSTIVEALKCWVESREIDVILSTGGTGITGRDVTPEAFRAVLERELPGFGELFRALSYAKIGTAAILSRALGGVAGGKLLFALPGSPSAVSDAWDGILLAQLDRRTLPGNLVRLMPRLQERG